MQVMNIHHHIINSDRSLRRLAERLAGLGNCTRSRNTSVAIRMKTAAIGKGAPAKVTGASGLVK